jgi:hypothetical protein
MGFIHSQAVRCYRAVLLEAWLESLLPYIETGQVGWKTLPQIYETYVQWEQEHGY